MATKAQAYKRAADRGLILEDTSTSIHWTVEVQAPDGQCIEPYLHGLVTHWHACPGEKADFWDEIISEIESVQLETCAADCHCKEE